MSAVLQRLSARDPIEDREEHIQRRIREVSFDMNLEHLLTHRRSQIDVGLRFFDENFGEIG
jgi:hypothetical protein